MRFLIAFYILFNVGMSAATPLSCSETVIASLQAKEFTNRFVSRYSINACKLIDLYNPHTKIVQCRANLKAVQKDATFQIVNCNVKPAYPIQDVETDSKCPCGWESVYVDGDGIINDYSYSICPCEERFEQP